MPEVSEVQRNAEQSANSFSITNITSFVSVKLTSDNYLSWKHQILTILNTLGLEKHVDAGSTPPLESSTEFLRWRKEDSYVSACINATLDSSTAHLAINTTTAVELWKILEDSYRQQVFARRNLLKTQFQNVKQGSSSIQEYCDNIKKITDSLKAIGEMIDETDLVLQTLQGLNSVYNTFVLNVENSENQPSFAQLRSRLLVYEERLNQQTRSNTSISIPAMNIDVAPPHSNSTKQTVQGNAICQICRKTGHEAAYCFFRYAQDSSRNNGRGYGRGNNGERQNRGGGRNFSSRGSGRNWRGHGYDGNWRGRGYDAYFARPITFGNEGVWNNGNTGYGPNVYPSNTVYNPLPTHDYQFNYLGSNNQSPKASNNQNMQPYFKEGNGQQIHSDGSNAFVADFGPDHFAEWTKQQGQNFSAYSAQCEKFSDVCAMVDSWVPDSGATAHMTSDPKLVQGAQVYSGPNKVIVGNVHDRNNTPPHSA